MIPNGIDPDDLQPQDPAELTRLRSEFAAPEEKLVLLIGRLVYEKGFQLALEAMPRVIEEVPGTRFLVAGSGTHEAELHSQAEELGLMEHGTFLGWIGDDVLHSLYRIADLTVVPSIYEPFGLVALEAMASGCPCIVADTGGLREVVPHEEAGLRFRAHDPEALAEVAIRVLSDDELGRRLVAEAYEHLRRFDWGDVAEQTAAVYADLVGETEPGLSGARPPAPSSAELADPGAARVPARSRRAARPAETERAGELDQGVDAGDAFAALELADLGAVQRGAHGRALPGRARRACGSGPGSPRSGRRCPSAAFCCLSVQVSNSRECAFGQARIPPLNLCSVLQTKDIIQCYTDFRQNLSVSYLEARMTMCEKSESRS